MLQNSDTGHTNFLKWSLGLSVILTPSLLFVPAWQSASGRNNERSVWSHLDSNRKLWCLCCAVPEERASSCDPGRGSPRSTAGQPPRSGSPCPGQQKRDFPVLENLHVRDWQHRPQWEVPPKVSTFEPPGPNEQRFFWPCLNLYKPEYPI